MITTQNQQYPKTRFSIRLADEPQRPAAQTNQHEDQKLPAVLLPGRIVTHHPTSGINPLVDAASYLFSILGKLKQLNHYQQIDKLQQQLITEVKNFQSRIKQSGYDQEYRLVCHYIICATFDDIIGNTSWGNQGQWEHYSLLKTFKQDPQHQSKFFTIVERAIKEPSIYIDLMELSYICLSLGYKGPYRATEHNHYKLEQITNNLYKHIRAYRGNANRALSPAPLRRNKLKQKYTAQGRGSLLSMSMMTACIVMTMFISLGYLMDMISNESFEHLAQIDQQHSEKIMV